MYPFDGGLNGDDFYPSDDELYNGPGVGANRYEANGFIPPTSLKDRFDLEKTGIQTDKAIQFTAHGCFIWIPKACMVSPHYTHIENWAIDKVLWPNIEKATKEKNKHKVKSLFKE